MAKCDEVSQFTEKNEVSQMQMGSGGIKTGFDEEGFAAGELLFELGL